MKLRTLTLIAAIALFAAVAISVQVSAQELQQHPSGAHSQFLTAFSAPRGANGSAPSTAPLVNQAGGAIPEYHQNARNMDNGVLGAASLVD